MGFYVRHLSICLDSWAFFFSGTAVASRVAIIFLFANNNNNNNRRLVTLAEHTSDHGKQTNSSTK